MGSGDACGRHLFEFIYFLVLLEESLLQSVEVYIEMISVQIDDVNRALVRSDVMTFTLHQESFGEVFGRLHKGNNGELLIFD